MRLRIAIILAVVCTLITAAGQLFLKLGADSLGTSILSIINVSLIIGLILYVVGAVILLMAFKSGELSVVYPFLSLSFIWVTLLSLFILKEVVSLYQWFGIILIMIGVFFIGKGGSKK